MLDLITVYFSARVVFVLTLARTRMPAHTRTQARTHTSSHTHTHKLAHTDTHTSSHARTHTHTYLGDVGDDHGQQVDRKAQDVEQRQRHEGFLSVKVMVFRRQHVRGKGRQGHLGSQSQTGIGWCHTDKQVLPGVTCRQTGIAWSDLQTHKYCLEPHTHRQTSIVWSHTHTHTGSKPLCQYHGNQSKLTAGRPQKTITKKGAHVHTKVEKALRYADFRNTCNSLFLMSDTFSSKDFSHAYNLST